MSLFTIACSRLDSKLDQCFNTNVFTVSFRSMSISRANILSSESRASLRRPIIHDERTVALAMFSCCPWITSVKKWMNPFRWAGFTSAPVRPAFLKHTSQNDQLITIESIDRIEWMNESAVHQCNTANFWWVSRLLAARATDRPAGRVKRSVVSYTWLNIIQFSRSYILYCSQPARLQTALQTNPGRRQRRRTSTNFTL